MDRDSESAATTHPSNCHSIKHPEGQLAQWIEVLQTYNFTIEHGLGKSMEMLMLSQDDHCKG